MAIAKVLAVELQRIPSWAKNVLIISGASIVLGLFAHLAIPLPFTPVPIVLQSSLILLLSVLLGPKRAVASVAAFLAQGAVGFPVFANGTAGLAKFVGPTGGYLIGYLAASFIVSSLIELFKTRSLLHSFYAMAAGQFAIYALGVAWLSTFLGFSQAILLGVVPFLIGDAIKMFLALKVLYWLGWSKPSSET